MNESYTSSASLSDLSLWERTKGKCVPYSFELELTPRFNLDCRHCYINLSAGDRRAKKNELSIEEISTIADRLSVKGS